MTYLEQHPPARSQYRRPRRAEPSGAIVAHTAENAPDLDGLDGGAEGVAAFIARRLDPGSYHTIVDADSIVRVVPFDAEAYGEGTGGNPWALHLSFACRTTTWDAIDPARRLAMLHNGARAAADMARWLADQGRPAPPAARIDAEMYRARRAGFISHAELDPRRRTDPGPAFPWTTFLDLYARELNMPTTTPTSDAMVEQWQRMLLDNGARLGDAGPDRDGADGLFGRLTLEASKVILDHRNQLLATVEQGAVLARKAEEAVAALLHRAETAEARAAQLEQQLAEAGTQFDRDDSVVTAMAAEVLAAWELVWEAAGRPGPLGGSKAQAVRDLLVRHGIREA